MNELNLSIWNIVQEFVLIHMFSTCPITVTLKEQLIFLAFFVLPHSTTCNLRQYAFLLGIYNLYYPIKMAGVPAKLFYSHCANSWKLQWIAKLSFFLSSIFYWHTINRLFVKIINIWLENIYTLVTHIVNQTILIAGLKFYGA
jgi:hypothetical protein